jgi:Na+/proline symporter
VSPLLLGVVGYVLLQLLIGVVVSRRIKNEDDYLVAGRRMGYGLSTFSIFATWFGAEACADAAGEVYEGGLSWSSTEPYAYGVALALAGLLLAAPLWSKKLTTLADLFRTRYSSGVERCAALLLIPTSLFWAAAQIRVFGHVISGASELSELSGMAIAAAAVILYTSFGGMFADAVTDVVQGTALIVGLGFMLFAIVGEVGGAAAAIETVDAERLRFSAAENAGWLQLVEDWSLPILGSLVAQELIARMSSARSGVVARRSAVAAGCAYALVGSIPVALGLLGPTLMPALEDPETLLPELARTHLSTLGFVLFAGALVSAILSTVDSALLVSSSLFSHNIVGRWRPAMDERSKLRVARACTVGFGVLSYVLATTPNSVGDLIDLTNGFGSAGVFVLLALGLFTRLGGPASALAALVAGSAVFSAGYFLDWQYKYVLSVGAALASYLVLARVGSARRSAAARN